MIQYLKEKQSLTKEKTPEDFYGSCCDAWDEEYYLQVLKEDSVHWNTSTPYDDVGKTMLHDCRRLIFPVLNEIFGTDYTGTEEIRFLGEEYQMNRTDGATEKRTNDSYIEVKTAEGWIRYHLEFQSYLDNTMVIRMVEYDFEIALDESMLEDDQLVLKIPRSAILYIQHTKKTPDEMKIKIIMPEETGSYRIPVMKIQNYTLEDFFEKKLLLLLPFYIFRFRSRFPKFEDNKYEREKLKDAFVHIRERLEKLCEAGELTMYEKYTIQNMTNKVIDNLAKNFKKIREEVVESMGGKVLDHDAKNFVNQGYKNGYEEGVKAAIEIVQLIREGILSLSDGAGRLGMNEQELARYM